MFQICLLFFLCIWRVPILPDKIHLIFFTSKKNSVTKSYPVFGVFDVFDVFYIFLEIKIKWMVGFFLCVWCNYTKKYVFDIFLLINKKMCFRCVCYFLMYLNIWRVPILPDEIHLIFFTSKKILFQKSYPVFGVFDVFDVF